MIRQIEMYEVTCDKCGKKTQVSGHDIEYGEMYKNCGWTETTIRDNETQHFCKECSEQMEELIYKWLKMVPGSMVLITTDDMYNKKLIDQYEKGHKQGYCAGRRAFKDDLAKRGLRVEIRTDDVVISGVDSACKMTVGDHKCTYDGDWFGVVSK